jgi:hypothetical protein
VRDTYHSIHVFQSCFQEFVRQDTRSILKAEETMVGKNGPNTHQMGMQDAFMAKSRETSMSMNELDTLSKHNSPEVGQKREEVRQCGRRSQSWEWQIVHFQSRQEPANANSVWRVTVGDHNNLPRDGIEGGVNT